MSEERESQKLLPCPFCGEDDPIVNNHTLGWWAVECDDGCGAKMIAETLEAAIGAWNRRAPAETGDRSKVIGWLKAKEAKWRETAALGLSKADECAGFYAAAYHNAWTGIEAGKPDLVPVENDIDARRRLR